MTSKKELWLQEISWQVLPPIIFVVIMLMFYPLRSDVGNDDEGVNVMKAMLLIEGHDLYSEIWSDQPPLLAHMLASLFKVTGYSVTFGRLYILILSAILMWAVVQFLRLVCGNLHGVAGGILLLLLPMYIGLSAHIMVGLPALTFAMLSLLALAFWHHRRQNIWLVVSALCLALSVMIKLFTAFLAPIFLFGVLIGEFNRFKEERSWAEWLKPSLIWGTVLTIGFVIGILALVGLDNLPQIINPNLEAQQVDVFQAHDLTIYYHMKNTWAFLVLAAVGILYVFWLKQWLFFYPAAWAAVAYLLLSQHAPVWSHQQLLVTIPISIMAAFAVGEAFQLLFNDFRMHLVWQPAGWISIVSIGLLFLVLVNHIPTTMEQFELVPQVGIRETSSESRFLAEMSKYSSKTQWVVTDAPIYAFRIRRPIPPHLAVFTSKRFLTDNLSEEDVLETIIEYEPEQVFLSRFEIPKVRSYLEVHYELVHSRMDSVLYVKRDLID